MAKKRQQDFHKTQMKPGRTVAKRKNVTNTSFRTKKITVQSKGQKSQDDIPDCLKRIKGTSQVAARISALTDLNKLIADSKTPLASFLSDVLESVLKLILEADENLRGAATDVVVNILKCTSDQQLQSFVPLLINVLSCSMTHAAMKVKEQSLTLLTPLLKSHPDLICHSMTILNNLLQMLVGIPRTRIHCQPSKSKSLTIVYFNDIYSPDWRTHVLSHINVFLKEILKKKSTEVENDRDEQEVYWNSESPMHLVIYAGSGLKLFDVETSYSISREELFEDSEEMLIFMNQLLQALPAIFIEETATHSNCDDHLLSQVQIHSLCTLFEVLCSVSEWLKLVPSENMVKAMRKFLKDNVYDKGRFPFCQRGAVFGKETQAMECVHLNLAVSFLYCTYLLDLVKDDDCIIPYVEDIFKMSSDVKFHAIPMLVKIMKIYFGIRETPEVSEFLCSGLFELCCLLKICPDDDPNKKLLTSLFSKMSLDSAYHFVVETDAMKIWFNWLSNELKEMPKTGNVDKKLLGITKKIANRRYPCFQMSVDFCAIKGLLRYNDDDARDTAIFLIYNMKDISMDVLDNIAHIILTDSTFPTKFAIRLIRLLTYRFSETPQDGENPEVSIYNAKGLINIVQFLLNVAIDSSNLNNEKFIDFEANEYTEAMTIIKDVTSYSVLPSLHWKKHSVLFEVCATCLSTLPKSVVDEVAVTLFKEILDNLRILPMHTAIAILKLNNSDMREKYYRVQIYDLILTALLTMSVLTRMSIDDDWYQYNVMELTDSMKLNNQLALEILHQVEFLKDNELEGIVAYHILRVCKFYVERQLLDPEDSQTVLRKLDVLKVKCSDKTIGQQPLFNSLYSHFAYFV